MDFTKLFRAPAPRRKRAAPDWPPPALPQHPWLTLVVGRRGCGKSYFTSRVLESWPDRQNTYAVDPVTPDPPTPDYPAYYARWWAPAPPLELRAGISLMVVDEADRFLPVAAGSRDSLLQDLVLRGRHRGTSLLLCTQRPALVATDARSQAGRIVVFRLTAEDDIRAVVRIAPELRGRESEIEQLPVGRCIVWDAMHGAWPEKKVDTVSDKA